MTDERPARTRWPRGYSPIFTRPPHGASPEEARAFKEDLLRRVAVHNLEARRAANGRAGVAPTLADCMPHEPGHLEQLVGQDWRLYRRPADHRVYPVWFISGTPPEVLIGITTKVVVATPVGVRDAAGQLTYWVDEYLLDVERHTVDLAAKLRAAVSRARELRRRTFRRCDRCSRLTPPEHVHDGDGVVCVACAGVHPGDAP